MRISDWSSDVCSSDLEALGEVLAAAVAEDVVALAVVTGEPAHVLDDALHLEVHLLRHEPRPLGDALRGRLRRGDDVDLGAGQELSERQRDVAGARGQVDEEEVGLVPEDVGSEEHTSELQSLMRSSYDVFCLEKKNKHKQ